MRKEQDRPRDGATQFDVRAERYAQSIPHSSGNSLTVVTQLARGRRYRRALDVGTGPGHVAGYRVGVLDLQIGQALGDVVDDLGEPYVAAAADVHRWLVDNL